mmetsp:Transcript_102017/g.283935  ORF Transcript_102017/g.283935 Transcript_102017/m.283935 type:complete len:299 (+) Transcript_102017:317-1213(+)
MLRQIPESSKHARGIDHDDPLACPWHQEQPAAQQLTEPAQSCQAEVSLKVQACEILDESGTFEGNASPGCIFLACSDGAQTMHYLHLEQHFPRDIVVYGSPVALAYAFQDYRLTFTSNPEKATTWPPRGKQALVEFEIPVRQGPVNVVLDPPLHRLPEKCLSLVDIPFLLPQEPQHGAMVRSVTSLRQVHKPLRELQDRLQLLGRKVGQRDVPARPCPVLRRGPPEGVRPEPAVLVPSPLLQRSLNKGVAIPCSIRVGPLPSVRLLQSSPSSGTGPAHPLANPSLWRWHCLLARAGAL